MMAKKTPIFWGCTFTHNYPFLARTTKTVLEEAGVETKDVEGFGCCPDPVYASPCGEEMSLALSARNLALAKKEGDTLIVACNGCYVVLKEAAEKLENKRLRDKVNESLPEDERYEGGLEVVHALAVLHAKIPVIKTKIEKPLSGIRAAAHYGCHAIYPPAVAADDPKNPSSMDDLIKAAGANTVEYESKLDCCGVPVAVYDRDGADRLLQKKLSDLSGRADCVVTACPACFMRFDMPPAELKDSALPVLHICELLALAMGVPKKDLFLEGHSTKVSPLFEKTDARAPSEKEIIEKNFDLRELSSHCGACREECTAAVATRNSEKPFDPLYAVDMLLAGRLYELLSGDEIWRCLQCGKCHENCPTNTGLKGLYAKLRELAVAEGRTKSVVEDKVRMISDTGYGMPRRAGVRKRMNITAAPELDSKSIKEVVEKKRRKKE